MSELLTPTVIEELLSFRKLILAYSGGLDSEVLLDLLCQEKELKKKLTLIHINHQLSPNANSWQKHCSIKAKAQNVPLICKSVTIELKSNLEEQARNKRYQIFKQLMTPSTCLLTAHHSSDLAETLLLNLFRGAGLEGLSSISFKRAFHTGELIRPLLFVSKEKIINYASNHQLSFVEDESNFDKHYRRNFIRHELMPKIKQYWPAIDQNLLSTTKHLQESKELLHQQDKSHLSAYLNQNGSLNLDIKTLNLPIQKRVIRLWLKTLGVKALTEKQLLQLIQEVIPASNQSKGVVKTSQYQIRRYKHNLYITNNAFSPINTCETKVALEKNKTFVELTNGTLSIEKCKQGNLSVPEHANITIKYRAGGELIKLKGQHKKIKTLLSELEVPPWERANLPLLYIDDNLIAVADFFFSEDFKPSLHPNVLNLTYTRNPSLMSHYSEHL